MLRFSNRLYAVRIRAHVLSAFILALFIVIPHLVHAQTASTLSSNFQIFPSQCNCTSVANPSGGTVNSAPAWGCILQTFQNVLTFAVFLAVVALTIFIAMAGFDYMTSGGSAEKRSAANKRIINVLLGLFITLAAYLLIDSLMKVIYDPSTAKFGPWNSILASSGTASDCLTVRPTPSTLPGLLAPSNGAGGTAPAGTTVPASSGTGACSGAAVQAAAIAGGVNMSSTEANTLACIAGPESGCGSLNQNYNWDGAKSSPPSTAWGPFQITLKGNAACFNNSACEQAAGVSGPLNCQNAFTSQGYSIPGQLLSECQTAAANLSCSAVAANCNIQANNGSYSAWTGNKDSTAAHAACVASGGSSSGT